jgi:hypothetical protein
MLMRREDFGRIADRNPAQRHQRILQQHRAQMHNAVDARFAPRAHVDAVKAARVARNASSATSQPVRYARGPTRTLSPIRTGLPRTPLITACADRERSPPSAPRQLIGADDHIAAHRWSNATRGIHAGLFAVMDVEH